MCFHIVSPSLYFRCYVALDQAPGLRAISVQWSATTSSPSHPHLWPKAQEARGRERCICRMSLTSSTLDAWRRSGHSGKVSWKPQGWLWSAHVDNAELAWERRTTSHADGASVPYMNVAASRTDFALRVEPRCARTASPRGFMTVKGNQHASCE